MLDGVDARRVASAMREDFEVAVRALRIDGGDNALATELFRAFADELRTAHRFGVDRDLVGAGKQQRADVLNRAHATPDSQRHETGRRRTLDYVEKDRPLLVARGDIEKAQLVG